MSSLSRLVHAALLALLLLLAQQGAIRHELLHHGASAARDADGPHAAAGDRCTLCVAFAHLAASVASHGFTAALLAGIAFALAAPLPVAALGAEPPAARSRGPPAQR